MNDMNYEQSLSLVPSSGAVSSPLLRKMQAMQQQQQQQLQSSVQVSVGEWKGKCQSVLVPPHECRQPRTSALTGKLSRSFPMRFSTNISQKRSKPDGSDRRLQWASSVDDVQNALANVRNSMHGGMQGFSPYMNPRFRKLNAGVPRRLTLHEKVQLYTNRPDLDLAGIMPRLEAIRRLERMNSLPPHQGSHTEDEIEECKDDEDEETKAEEKKEEDREDEESKRENRMEEDDDDDDDVDMSHRGPQNHDIEEKTIDKDRAQHSMTDSDDEECSPKVGIDFDDDNDTGDEEDDKELDEFGEDRYEVQQKSSGASYQNTNSAFLAFKKQRLQKPLSNGNLSSQFRLYSN